MARRPPVQGTTLLRLLPYKYLSELSLLLDPVNNTFMDWRGLASRILRSPNDDQPRYGTLEIANFELEYRRAGGSPTVALINDWGTANATVQDLVGYLVEMGHNAAAETLLPGITAELNLNQPSQVSSSTKDAYSTGMYGGSNFASPNPHSEGGDKSLEEDTVQIAKRESQRDSRTRSDRSNGCSDEVSSSTESNAAANGAPCERRQPQEDDESLVVSCLPDFEPNTVKEFDYIDLSTMTNGFDDRPLSEGGNMVGEGGFGTVYHGRFGDGHECAVKKLKQDVFCCSDVEVTQQYQNELRMLKSLKHVNLVELYGFSFDGSSPCLVFNYLKNGSLLSALSKDSCLDLPWEARVHVVQGMAQGLCYLHQNDMVHRDVKSANVLLDDDFTAKVADFGLIRAVPDGDNRTYFTNIIIGTNTYMPPEARYGTVSSKGDSFSYGVVLLEVITGLESLDTTRENRDIISHVEDVVDNHPDGILSIVDRRLGSTLCEAAIVQLFVIANDCLNGKKNKRPFLSDVLPKLMALEV